MRRVAVLGPPGSGKSTLARQIGARLGLPVFHLDQAHWQAGWVKTPPDAFRAEVERIAALPGWVMDGNYTGTLAPRLATADTLVHLDAPAWVCLPRIVARTLAHWGRVRADAATGCPERMDPAFLRFAWSWNQTHRTSLRTATSSFKGQVAVLRTHADRRRFLATLS